jgi:hypothetical protein
MALGVVATPSTMMLATAKLLFRIETLLFRIGTLPIGQSRPSLADVRTPSLFTYDQITRMPFVSVMRSFKESAAHTFVICLANALVSTCMHSL